MKIQIFSLLLTFIIFFGCKPETDRQMVVSSPNGKVLVEFLLTEQGAPAYVVRYDDRSLIDTSFLGFEFRDQEPLRQKLVVKDLEQFSFDQPWETTWGEDREIRNAFQEMIIELEERDPPNRRFNLIFRAYDDGVAFRYFFPAQVDMEEVVITDEYTEFNLTGDHRTWWIPGDWDIYEHIYNDTRFSEIDALSKRDHPNLAQTYIPENAVNTPVTMKTDDGLYLSFHEAALYNYSGMTLKVDKENLKWVSELVGSPDGAKVKTKVPFQTPWRTIQIAERAGDLIESHLILNLNEPSMLEDVSWIRPMKYAGIWWEMHLTKSSWDMASGRHGATTEHAKEMIDFCAENQIEGLLVEGWNTGWEHWIGFEDREGVFDFVTPYPDYDLEEVVRYAKEKGVAIVMHHETSAAPRTYEQQLDTAYALMEDLGIHAVKTGYVGKIIPAGEYHHGQWMVNHYQKVLETAAKHKVMVDAHEPIKATGKRRTWPNMMTREGLRGQEFNAFSVEGGNPTDHLTVVAFTRMLAGPIDYTPGIFKLKLDPYRPGSQVKHTLAHELALYVVVYSPLQMAADLPENYEGQPAMQFIRDVAVDWEQTRVIDGEPGDFVIIARQERGGERWFLGAISDENGRELSIPLDFLDDGKNYRAVMYTDDPDAHWKDNPTAIQISEQMVTKATALELIAAPGGGAAVVLTPTE